jgi:alpha-glucosidase
LVYHIYPRSFYDADHDGIGDLKGITEKLDYLKGLGVDAIWLSPVYPTPNFDFGYDVSDYQNIDETFGTLDNFRNLLNEAHKRDIRVIMDMILNHTSVEHPWFVESRSDTKNPKRDWYIWRKGVSGRKPNNWKSVYGGSAWEPNSPTNHFYLHTFFKEQPDLNWRNKEVIDEFMKIFKFWLDLGVDGFRLDVINMIIKDKKFRNNPGLISGLLLNRKWYTRNRPRSFKIIRKLRNLLDSYDDRMCVGEVYTLPPGDSELAGSYLVGGDDGMHMAFDFSLLFRRWNARKYFKTIEKWYASIPAKGWPCNVLSNHDLRRSIGRFGSGRNKYKKARVAATLLLTLKGTPFIYYGEEIGMQNGHISRRNLQDPLGKKFWPFYAGRDQSRTPMQWNNRPFAGFSTVKPWLPVNHDYQSVNVESALLEPDSLINFYTSLISLRKNCLPLMMGDWKPAIRGINGVIAYYRISGDKRILVILNFTSRYKMLEPGEELKGIMLHSSEHSTGIRVDLSEYMIEPFEASVIEVNIM